MSQFDTESERERESLAFDTGPVSAAVSDLVRRHFNDLITVTRWESMLGGDVTVLIPAYSVDAWSSGEYVMWQFLASVAGKGQVVMREVAGYFRDTDVARSIMAVVEAQMLGVVPSVEVVE